MPLSLRLSLDIYNNKERRSRWQVSVSVSGRKTLRVFLIWFGLFLEWVHHWNYTSWDEAAGNKLTVRQEMLRSLLLASLLRISHIEKTPKKRWGEELLGKENSETQWQNELHTMWNNSPVNPSVFLFFSLHPLVCLLHHEPHNRIVFSFLASLTRLLFLPRRFFPSRRGRNGLWMRPLFSSVSHSMFLLMPLLCEFVSRVRWLLFFSLSQTCLPEKLDVDVDFAQDMFATMIKMVTSMKDVLCVESDRRRKMRGRKRQEQEEEWRVGETSLHLFEWCFLHHQFVMRTSLSVEQREDPKKCICYHENRNFVCEPREEPTVLLDRCFSSSLTPFVSYSSFRSMLCLFLVVSLFN